MCSCTPSPQRHTAQVVCRRWLLFFFAQLCPGAWPAILGPNLALEISSTGQAHLGGRHWITVAYQIVPLD